MTLSFVRRGVGRRLLLIHGLGGSWRSWSPVLSSLEAAREVIAVDLPGHGDTQPGPGSDSFTGLVDQVETFMDEQGLAGIDVAGSSLGGRIALELARRGSVGATVALGPGGFWRGWERTYLGATLGASVRVVRALGPARGLVARTAVTRSALLAQLSARPWRLPAELVATELQSIVRTANFDTLLRDLAVGPEQTGPAADPSHPVAIGWGVSDRLCLPRQASRAQAAFPSARLHWFDACGHFPMWDRPGEAARLILETTEPRADVA
jgi:pimeloyl-ACP methyl ester carboxylesterase